MALIGAVAFSTSGAYAACGCANTVEAARTPFYYYLNPLQYVGIGNNYTNFSLNPFTGFKNCNKAKVKKCDECTKVIKPCPTCKKAFAEPTCDTCEKIYIQPVQPKCPCQK